VVRYRLNVGTQPVIVDAPHHRNDKTHAVGSSVGLIVDPRRVAVVR
jgi:hypothetical protein